ncbi:fibronectin type III domain-containing protein [Nocardioides antri]|uniref:Fibronectin type III domain-containing protein n=1 Tax=Nocardioides antri TaxID=2607659 RepID=A0A5B1LUG5_9ACTN|nr:fibronectin type III domain-containing protein [Nocardioides antri]KAA1423180.1 fibronectin type III domain-containing protein [Nocardioides antri]
MTNPLRAGLAVGLLAVAAWAGVTAAPALATADSDPVTLDFRCTYPLIGPRALSVAVSTNLPATIEAGTATAPVQVTAVATISDDTTSGLVMVGSKSLVGSALASAHINGPSTDLDLSVPATLEPTPVPASGAFDTVARATIEPLTFPAAGSYEITVDDLLLSITPRDAAGRTTGLDSFDSDCSLDAGQDTVIATVEVTGDGDTTPPAAPAAPTSLRTTNVGTTSVGLAWTAPADPDVAGYDVFRGSTKVVTVTGTSATVAGLTPATSYTFTVKAHDQAGNVSPASPPLTVTTTSATTRLTYALAGTSHLAAADTTVALRGTLAATYDGAAGGVTADVSFEPTSATLRMYQFFPVTARLVLAPTAPTAGTLQSGVLTTRTTTLVRVPTVTFFGFPVGGGPSCRTISPTTVVLRSAAGFLPAKGGVLTGRYALPSLVDCGGSTSALSAAVAGPDNTVRIGLTPRG